METPRHGSAVEAIRGALLLLGLSLGALITPWPWAAAWLVVPVLTASGLLLAWRYGPAAWALTVALALGAGAVIVWPVGGLAPWHVMWLPLVAAVGTWMGLREEGGGPTIGERAWMHVPLLAGACLLPLLPGFHDSLVRADARAREQERQLLAAQKTPAAPGSFGYLLEEHTKLPAEDRVRMITYSLPNLAFSGLVLLIAAGRALAARIAARRRWPALSRAPFMGWRLPDAALVPLIVGLAVLLLAPSSWWPVGVVLLVQSVLGYGVQGLAVVWSVIGSRVPPLVLVLVSLFLFVFTLPVLLVSLALIGLSDVWWDHRRLEPSPNGEA